MYLKLPLISNLHFYSCIVFLNQFWIIYALFGARFAPEKELRWVKSCSSISFVVYVPVGMLGLLVWNRIETC